MYSYYDRYFDKLKAMIETRSDDPLSQERHDSLILSLEKIACEYNAKDIRTLNLQSFLNSDKTKLENLYLPIIKFFQFKIILPKEFCYEAYQNLLFLTNQLNKVMDNFYLLTYYITPQPIYYIKFLSSEDMIFFKLSGILEKLSI